MHKYKNGRAESPCWSLTTNIPIGNQIVGNTKFFDGIYEQ